MFVQGDLICDVLQQKREQAELAQFPVTSLRGGDLQGGPLSARSCDHARWRKVRKADLQTR